jgi:hypothetical protein
MALPLLPSPQASTDVVMDMIYVYWQRLVPLWTLVPMMVLLTALTFLLTWLARQTVSEPLVQTTHTYTAQSECKGEALLQGAHQRRLHQWQC